MSKGRGVSSYTHTQQQLDAYANQHNPNNHAYWDDLDNHANQCNPNNDEYWHSRENDEDDDYGNMKRLKEINLEDGKPTVADALIILKSSINNAKSGNVGCLYIIHGYGSSGKGGAIRDKVRQWLNAQARNGVVKCVINGEDFNIFNFKALELKNKYKELEQLLRVCNHGITVVEFKHHIL